MSNQTNAADTNTVTNTAAESIDLIPVEGAPIPRQPPAPTIDNLRAAKIRRRMLEEEFRTAHLEQQTARLREASRRDGHYHYGTESHVTESSWDTPAAYGLGHPSYHDNDREFHPQGFARDTAYNRRGGRDWPHVRTELDLDRFRYRSRYLCKSNSHAKGLLKNLVNYVVGSGPQIKITPRDDLPDADPNMPGHQDAEQVKALAEQAQQYFDEWAKHTRFRWRARELYLRQKRDGEAFLRLFGPSEDQEHMPYLYLRWVEPAYVRQPPDGTEQEGWTLGVKHLVYDDGSEDVETITHYHLINPRYFTAHITGEKTGEFPPAPVEEENRTATGEIVDADEIIHVKNLDEDATIKRGLPEFVYDTYDALVRASSLLRQTSEGSALRASFAMVSQWATATGAQIGTFVHGEADQLVPKANNAGMLEPVKTVEGPLHVHVPKGHEFVPVPSAAGVSTDVQIEQADLRAALAGFCAPEFFSGDASNGNFACHDSETELLTKRGWLKWSRLRDGDEAGTMNPETCAFEWQKIEHIHVYEYDGDMVHFCDQHADSYLDAMVTPNHRMWHADVNHRKPTDNRFSRADEIRHDDVLTLCCFEKAQHYISVRGDYISYVSYKGVVWCVTVPNGLIVTRRNGKSLISGNSIKEAGSPIARAVEAEQEYLVEVFEHIAELVLTKGVQTGHVPPEVLELCEVQAELPKLMQRDRQVMVAENVQLVAAQLQSPQTAMMELGLDPDKEEANWAQWMADHQQGGAQPQQAQQGGPQDPAAMAVQGGGDPAMAAQGGMPQDPQAQGQMQMGGMGGAGGGMGDDVGLTDEDLEALLQESYDPSELRDSSGRWSSSGAGGDDGDIDGDDGNDDPDNDNDDDPDIADTIALHHDAGNEAIYAHQQAIYNHQRERKSNLFDPDGHAQTVEHIDNVLSHYSDHVGQAIKYLQQSGAPSGHIEQVKKKSRAALARLQKIGDRAKRKSQALHDAAEKLASHAHPGDEPKHPGYPPEPEERHVDEPGEDATDADWDKYNAELEKASKEHGKAYDAWDRQTDKIDADHDRAYAAWEKAIDRHESATGRVESIASAWSDALDDLVGDDYTLDDMGLDETGHLANVREAYDPKQPQTGQQTGQQTQQQPPQQQPPQQPKQPTSPPAAAPTQQQPTQQQPAQSPTPATGSDPHAQHRAEFHGVMQQMGGGKKGKEANSDDKKSKRFARKPKPLTGNVFAGEAVWNGNNLDLKLVPVDKLKTTEEIDLPGKVQKFVRAFEKNKKVPPLVVDRQGFIRDGHHRFEAAIQSGLTHVWVMRPKKSQADYPDLAAKYQQQNQNRRAQESYNPTQARGDAENAGHFSSTGGGGGAQSAPAQPTGVVDQAMAAGQAASAQPPTGQLGAQSSQLPAQPSELSGQQPAQPSQLGAQPSQSGAQPSDQQPGTQPPDTPERAQKKSLIVQGVKTILKAVNAAPEFAKATVLKAGFHPKIANAAMVFATVGDWIVPAIPAGSALMVLAATIKRPSAPIGVVKDIINAVLGRKPEQQAGGATGGVREAWLQEDYGAGVRSNYLNPESIAAIGRAISAAGDPDWYITVLAVALEEHGGDMREAMRTAQMVAAKYPQPPQMQVGSGGMQARGMGGIGGGMMRESSGMLQEADAGTPRIPQAPAAPKSPASPQAPTGQAAPQAPQGPAAPSTTPGSVFPLYHPPAPPVPQQTQQAQQAQPSTNYDHARSPEFKNWFGDWEGGQGDHSKIVDHENRPMRVYHGTRKAFKTFDADKGLSATDKLGSWFAGTPEFAGNRLRQSDMFGLRDQDEPLPKKSQIVPAYLNIRKPLRVAQRKDITEIAAQKMTLPPDVLKKQSELTLTPPFSPMSKRTRRDLENYYTDPKARERINQEILGESAMLEPDVANELAQHVRQVFADYDGIIVDNDQGQGTAYVAFHPHQIKSAIANRGAYNPASNKIHESDESDGSINDDATDSDIAADSPADSPDRAEAIADLLLSLYGDDAAHIFDKVAVGDRRKKKLQEADESGAGEVGKKRSRRKRDSNSVNLTINIPKDAINITTPPVTVESPSVTIESPKIQVDAPITVNIPEQEPPTVIVKNEAPPAATEKPPTTKTLTMKRADGTKATITLEETTSE